MAVTLSTLSIVWYNIYGHILVGGSHFLHMQCVYTVHNNRVSVY